MITYNKLDNYFVVSADRQTFLGFEMTANLRDTSPQSTYLPTYSPAAHDQVQIAVCERNISSFFFHQIQKLEDTLRKQAYGLVHNKKQQRQLEEELRWSQVKKSVFFFQLSPTLFDK